MPLDSGAPLRLLSAPRRSILLHLRRADGTIQELASALAVTGNAIRGHLAALRRDGLIEAGPTARREGAGKPAQLYRLSAAGEELFPRGYSRIVVTLLDLLAEWDGPEGVAEVMREIGARLGREGDGTEGAIRALGALGAEVERVAGGVELTTSGCPLAAATAERPHLCALMAALVSGAAGAPVTDLCDRGEGRTRCRFALAESARP